jgi:uncharacterized protein (TIGR02453 family)
MIGPHFFRFPEAGLRFLRRLKRNNNREWFLANKEEYEEFLKKPMEDLVEALALEFARFAPEFQASPRISLYRIYRDTRFSKDKTPYKTRVAAIFPPRGLGKHDGAGLYFHISTTELLIGGGLYMPSPEDLQAVRTAIASDYQNFEAIVQNRGFRRLFGELSGEQLTRVPRGFPAGHEAADYLRLKQFLAGRKLSPKVATSPGFQKAILETFVALTPLLRFLNQPILSSRRETHRKASLLV